MISTPFASSCVICRFRPLRFSPNYRGDRNRAPRQRPRSNPSHRRTCNSRNRRRNAPQRPGENANRSPIARPGHHPRQNPNRKPTRKPQRRNRVNRSSSPSITTRSPRPERRPPRLIWSAAVLPPLSQRNPPLPSRGRARCLTVRRNLSQYLSLGATFHPVSESNQQRRTSDGVAEGTTAENQI